MKESSKGMSIVTPFDLKSNKESMLSVIVYDDISKKNSIESSLPMVLDSHERLIHTLNMMDFMIALNPKANQVEDGIDWIVLEFKAS